MELTAEIRLQGILVSRWEFSKRSISDRRKTKRFTRAIIIFVLQFIDLMFLKGFPKIESIAVKKIIYREVKNARWNILTKIYSRVALYDFIFRFVKIFTRSSNKTLIFYSATALLYNTTFTCFLRQYPFRNFLNIFMTTWKIKIQYLQLSIDHRILI